MSHYLWLTSYLSLLATKIELNILRWDTDGKLLHDNVSLSKTKGANTIHAVVVKSKSECSNERKNRKQKYSPRKIDTDMTKIMNMPIRWFLFFRLRRSTEFWKLYHFRLSSSRVRTRSFSIILPKNDKIRCWSWFLKLWTFRLYSIELYIPIDTLSCCKDLAISM